MIRLDDLKNDRIVFRDKDYIEGPFKKLYISNLTARAGETVELIISSPKDILFSSNVITVTVGTIVAVAATIERDKSHYFDADQDQNCFHGSVTITPGAVTPFVQLFNPNASGKKLALISADGYSNVAAGTVFSLARYNTPLPDEWVNTYNNYLDGPGPVAEMRYRVGGAAPVPSQPLERRTSDAIGANINSKVKFTLKKPLVIAPNKGAVVHTTGAGSTLMCNLEWIEIDV